MLDSLIFDARPGNSAVLLPNSPVFTIIGVSNDFVRSTGVPREELIGRGFFEKFPESPLDPEFTGEENIRASLEYVLRHKMPHGLPQQRYDIPNGDGTFTEKYWRPYNVPVLGETGDLLYLIHTAEDVTDRVIAEKTQAAHDTLALAYHQIEESQKALSIAHERIVDILESTNDAFYAVDAGFHFTYVNKRAAQLWGKRSESLIGQHYWTVFPNAVNSQSYHKHYEALRTNQSVHYETISPSLGIWIDTSIYPSKDGGLSVFFRDITERKQAEMALRESEERFRIMADAVPQSMWITDSEGRVEFLNKHWCDYCGVPFSETTATDISMRYLHPEDASKVMQAFGEAMRTGEPWEVEQRNRSKEGEYRWFLNRANPYRDPATGTIIKWFGVGIDIHDRKLAEEVLRSSEEALEKKVKERTHELERANQELKRSNQNLEDFAYAASHDMKEPIRKIRIFADRLKERLKGRLADEDQWYLERLEAATKRMSTLIDDLLDYSHVSKGVSSMERADLSQVLSSVLDDLELHIQEYGATVEADSLPTITGHPRQLQQLFENLIGNALKYSKQDVAPKVRLTSRLVKGSDLREPAVAANADKMYLLIEIQDNGIGFDQEDAERIFNLFTRLHGNTEYQGTGVGLSIAQTVVKNHSGTIWAESKPSEGSTFKVLLPTE